MFSLFSRQKPVVVDPARVEELLERGVSEVISHDELKRKLLSGRRLRVKLGIDPTSPDLHLGRAIPLLKLRDFQELGHHVVFIVGDFTAVIGDTSDKDAERPMLSREVIEHNKKTYFAQAGKLIDLAATELRHNSEWLEKLAYRDIGEHADLFSVSDFIARENIARRLAEGKRVSLREVLYPLMQGYDSVAVRADVELGGMDQKFNLLAGRVLQAHFKQEPQNILMNPLINGTDGRKMSSSWGNTIPLTAAPSDMYGKVMSMHDGEIGTYFMVATRIPIEEARRITRELAAGTMHPKDAKMRLARELVSLYHGKEAARRAEDDFVSTFSGGGVPADAPRARAAKGTTLGAVLLAHHLVDSKSELQRLLSQRAVSSAISGAVYTDAAMPLETSDTFRVGKRRFLIVEVYE